MKHNRITGLAVTTTELTQAQEQYKKDKSRLVSRKDALLDLLQDGEWHANYVCAQVGGLSFNCSITALRKEGWHIEARPVAGGVWERRLVGKSTNAIKAAQVPSGPQQRVAREFELAVKKTYGQEGLQRVGDHLTGWLKEHALRVSGEDQAVSL